MRQPKEIKAETKDLEIYIKDLQGKDPIQYLKEKEELTEKLTNLRVEHFEVVMKVYPEKNPLKYNTVDNEGISKKEAMAAKLVYLKEGGDPILWDYPKWRRANEGTPEPTEIPCSAEKCDFKAKNATGLTTHVKAKHPVDETPEGDNTISDTA